MACKTRHLITNLVVPERNLTCLREMKQQHDKDMKHYVACKMRHLITNLVVPKLNLTCLREMKQQHDKDMKHYVACEPIVCSLCA
jgi:hypothetical protein